MRPRYTLTGLLVIVGLLAVAASLALPALLRSRRYAAQRASIQAMSMLINAEKEFAANDLDGNGRADYWTRDVRGLTRFRARGSSAGLIDEGLAKADAGHPGAVPLHGHLFLMLEKDEAGNPVADSSGCGPRLLYCMYPARYPEFTRTSVYDIDMAWWTSDNGGQPVRRWIPYPSSEGWAKTD